MNTRNSMLRVLYGCLILVAVVSVACGPSGDAPAGDAPATETASAPTPAPAANSDASMPAGSAVVTGTVTYSGSVPNFKPINMDADPTCASMHDEPVLPDTLVLGEGNTMGYIFVQVQAGAPEQAYPVPSEAVTIDQVGCRYEPHVAGVMAGQPLQFKNSDGILHNVHGLPKTNREFNLGMPASLTEKDTVLNKPEKAFPVKCDVHPWMQSYVAVMEHPYFDVTSTDGKFSLENLPAGTYTISAWHERLPMQTAEVTVGDGETQTIDFTFSAPG